MEAYLTNPLHRGVSCCSEKHATQHLSQIPSQHKKCLMSSLGLSKVESGGCSVVELCLRAYVLGVGSYRVINQIPKKCGSKSCRIPVRLDLK